MYLGCVLSVSLTSWPFSNQETIIHFVQSYLSGSFHESGTVWSVCATLHHFMIIIVWLYCFHIYKYALDVAELGSLSSSLSGVGVDLVRMSHRCQWDTANIHRQSLKTRPTQRWAVCVFLGSPWQAPWDCMCLYSLSWTGRGP